MDSSLEANLDPVDSVAGLALAGVQAVVEAGLPSLHEHRRLGAGVALAARSERRERTLAVMAASAGCFGRRRKLVARGLGDRDMAVRAGRALCLSIMTSMIEG
jgi:hypothetical protein